MSTESKCQHGRFLLRAIVVFVVVLALTIASVDAQTPKPSMRFCYIAQVGSLAQQVLFGVPYYASKYDSIDWSVQLVGKNGNVDSRDAVQGVLAEMSVCDIFLGPGSSGYSIALSQVIQKPWIDFASTSTVLSEKATHPYFSRIIPTDEVGSKGMMSILDHYNWKSAYLVCSEEAYGRSLASALEAEISQRGGSFITRCVNSDADRNTMNLVMRDIRKSKYRVVAVLMAGWVDAFVNLLHEAESFGMNNSHVFVFGESICSGWGSLPTNIHGSFCVAFGYDYNAYINFYDQLKTAETKVASVWKAEIERVGLSYSKLANTSDVGYHGYVYDAFNIDAFLHGMIAIHNAQTQGKFNKANVSNTIEIIRSYRTDGFSGPVRLNANGDRPDTLMDLSTVAPDGIRKFGNWTAEGGFYHDLSLGTIYVPLAGSSDKIVTSDSNDGVMLIIAVVVPILFVLIIGAGMISIMSKLTSSTRFAPKDSKQPFAMLTLDMQKSTSLWDRFPDQMPEVLRVYNTVIRNTLRRHKVYEVNTQGDSFTVVAQSVSTLTDVACELQQKLVKSHWPHGYLINQFYESLGEHHEVTEKDYRAMWNGPRIRVSIHYGTGIISKVGSRYEYHGEILDVCKEMENSAHGGQVVVSKPALQQLASSSSEQPHAVLFDSLVPEEKDNVLGSGEVSKVPIDPVDVYSLSVPGLELRVFAPKTNKGRTPVAVLASTTPSNHSGNPFDPNTHHSHSEMTSPENHVAAPEENDLKQASNNDVTSSQSIRTEHLDSGNVTPQHRRSTEEGVE